MRFVYWLTTILLFSMVQVAEAAQLKIILRYDDYSRYSNADVDQALFDAAISVGSGFLVSVIPFPYSPIPIPGSDEPLIVADLDEQKIDILKRYASQGSIEIAVHGYGHKNNAIEKPNSEFVGLPEKIQSHLLSTAKDSLEAAIGVRISSFVPPFNTYDKQTLKSLESNGYKLISAGLRGPILHDGNLAYLPGGPYPQSLKNVVLSAITKGHTDATVISTMHPYDLLEAGVGMVDFRRGASQISIQKLTDDLHDIKQLKEVRFMPISELVEGAEDLSADRLQTNLKLKGSFVTRQRLLPEVFNIYPLTGLYYSQDSANRMYMFQITAFVLLYGLLILVVTLMTGVILRRFRSRMKYITVLASTISIVGILSLLAKSLATGFYMIPAVGLVCFLSVLVGIAINQWRTAP